MSGSLPIPPTGTGAEPGWYPGYVPSAAEWNAWWSTKIDTDDPVFQTGPWLPLGGGTMLGNLVLAADPTIPMEAATKQYVDALTPAAGPFLPLSGGIMTGVLTLASMPVNPFDAVPKQYADAIQTLANTALLTAQAAVPITGGTMTGFLLLSGDPVAPLGAATKQYADRMLPLAGGTMTGALNVNAQLTANAGAYVSSLNINAFNGWEWSFGVDANGDKIQSYRANWYDYWSSADGSRNWVGPSGGLMQLDAGGDLWIAGTFAATGNVNGVTFNGQDAEMTGEVRSTNGRLVSAGSVASVCVWDPSINSAGMFLGNQAGGALCFGGMDQGGDFVGPLFGYFDFSGNFNANGLWCSLVSDFGLTADSNGDCYLSWAPDWFIQWNSSVGNVGFYNAAGFWGCIVNANGDLDVYGNVYASNVSDARTKRDIQPYTRGLAALMQLNPIFYRHNGQGGTKDDNRVHYGLSAQDVQPVIPEAVYPTPDPRRPGEPPTRLANQLSLDDKPLFYAMFNAIKELGTRVESLEARVP